MKRSTLQELPWPVGTTTVDAERSADWKEIRRATVPLAFRWMFRPVGYPNEAGLPEHYSMLEVPDSKLWALGFVAVLCFLAGIIGVSGWPFLMAASIVIVFLMHFALNLQIQLLQNAVQQFRSSKSSETCPPECD